MAGSLQQNVRALMVRASSPMPSSDRQQDEVARLRAQLQHSKKVNGDMRALLQNQALAIEQLQNRWQMAGQEAHAFVVRTRSESEDFVRAELGAIERFEDRVQRQYSGELQQHVHALQDECRAHVGQEESKLQKELTSALTHESQVCKDSEVLSHQEVAQLRGLVAAQQEELRSIHSDCAELQRRSAATEQSFSGKAHMKNMPCINTLMMRSRRGTPRSTPCSTSFRVCKRNKEFSWKQSALKQSVAQLRYPSLRKELRRCDLLLQLRRLPQSRIPFT